MAPNQKRSMQTKAAQLICAGAICLAAACGPKPADNSATPARSANVAKTPASNETTPGGGNAARPPQFISQFSSNNVRDPFHPKAKPTKTPDNTAQPAVPVSSQIIAALENSNIQIFVSGAERMALVSGVLLAPQSDATLNIQVEGGNRRIKVKALKILPNLVELQVEGIPQPVTISPKRK